MKTHFLSSSKDYALGSKAQRLAELVQAGFPVPLGFVTATNDQSVEELRSSVSAIGGFPVAARSSGTIEDLGDASFAGMYESYLELQSVEELKEAISKCFQSARSARVQDYLATHKKQVSPDQLEASMRVLVQRMVDADRAGVLFTIDPVHGAEENLYVEVCQGLGERLVSGHVTPSRYHYNWQESRLDKSEINIEGTELSSDELNELSALAIKIQSFYGHPQDIEFAIDKQGKIWILQSRPVTHVSWRKDVPELTNADFKDGGVSARVCPPMMYSLYEAAIQSSMGRYFQDINLVKSGDAVKWIHYYYGRAYWNAGAVKEGLSKIPGFNELDFDKGLGITKDYGVEGPLKVGVTPTTILTALMALCGLTREYQDCRRMIDAFTPWFEKVDAQLKIEINGMSQLDDDMFFALARRVYDCHFKTETSYFRTIYNNSNTQSDFKSALGKLDPENTIDALALVSGLEHMAHMDIQKDFLKLAAVARSAGFESAQWQSELTSFLSYHYHHGDVELDIRVPRWGERPARIREIVQEMLALPAMDSRVKQDWRVEWEKLEQLKTKNLSWRLYGRASFNKQLHSTRDYLTRRELMRTYSTRAYYNLRLVLLEGEKRLKLAEGQVHLLSISEFLKREVPNKSELEIREMYLNGYRDFQAPNEFGGSLKEAAVQDLSGNSLQGIGCSSGEIEAVARVILSIEEAQQLLPGEVLITKFTDPGWTPVMSKAAAVVTEVGGVLSHAAVIGREYGIPAVLNASGATKFFTTGERIRVNGRTGVVTRLEENA